MCIRDFNVNHKIVKVLEENIEDLCIFDLGKTILDKTSKTSVEEKFDRLDFIKINFCFLKILLSYHQQGENTCKSHI